VLAFRFRPGGRTPETMLQLKGPVPPETVRVVVYTALTIPFGKLVVTIVRGAAVAVSVAKPDSVPPQVRA
jgi:hypothetical protein